MTDERRFDVAVIGAGVVGAAIARALSHYELTVALLEAGTDVGARTSKANTAILHTGFDAKPHTIEGALVARGSELLRAYATETGIAVETTGALLVAWTDEQQARLPSLAERAAANHYDRCRLVDRAELAAREPHIGPGALGALSVPDESIIDPWAPVIAFATEAVRNGATLLRDSPVTAISESGDDWALVTPRGTIRAGWLINAAGLHSDTVDEMFGRRDFTVTPRRGQLIVFDKLARGLVHHILLPVPTETTKGVLVSPTVFGNVLLGPTAEDLDDKCDTASTREGLDGLLAQGRRILPALVDHEVTAVYAGLRAATEHSDYRISWHEQRRFVTVGSIRSTGLTASPAIAEYVCELLVRSGLALTPRSQVVGVRMPALGESSRRPFADAERIADDPEYGRIVCHCERVTRGEIRDACAGPVPPVDLDGLRRRTRVLMGRCQGFACLATVTELLAAATSHSLGPAGTRPATEASGAASGAIGASIEARPRRSERDQKHRDCDVLIVGGGPAGLATATALRGLGVESVVVVEREDEPGGIARHSDHTGYGLRDLHRVMRGPAYARALTDRAMRAGAEILTEASVTGWHGPATERSVEITSPSGTTIITTRALVLATGCRERPRAARLVPGTRPSGVLTTGALQRLVARGLPVGTRALVVGAEHVSYSAALTLRHAGVSVAAMVTREPAHESFAVFAFAARVAMRIPLRVGTAVTRILGRTRVEAVELTDLARGTTEVVECDTVVFTGDWVPDYELARRGRLVIDPGTAAPRVDAGLRTSVPGVFAAGNLLHGAETADVCALDGRWAATSVTQWLSSGLSVAAWPVPEIAVETGAAPAVDLTQCARGRATPRAARSVPREQRRVRSCRARRSPPGRLGALVAASEPRTGPPVFDERLMVGPRRPRRRSGHDRRGHVTYGRRLESAWCRSRGC